MIEKKEYVPLKKKKKQDHETANSFQRGNSRSNNGQEERKKPNEFRKKKLTFVTRLPGMSETGEY